MTLTPDSIDWTHVAPQYKWMARDENDEVYFYSQEPICYKGFWETPSLNYGIITNALNFSSYRRGTCDWRDSLVQRPDGV